MKIAPNRNGLEIKIWMMRKGITQPQIEREAEVVQSNVSRTISGERNCRAVLSYLLKKGCPRKYLALPKDMQEAA